MSACRKSGAQRGFDILQSNEPHLSMNVRIPICQASSPFDVNIYIYNWSVCRNLPTLLDLNAKLTQDLVMDPQEQNHRVADDGKLYCGQSTNVQNSKRSLMCVFFFASTPISFCSQRGNWMLPGRDLYTNMMGDTLSQINPEATKFKEGV